MSIRFFACAFLLLFTVGLFGQNPYYTTTLPVDGYESLGQARNYLPAGLSIQAEATVNRPTTTEFQDLLALGPVYTYRDRDYYKVRVGTFNSLAEANRVLRQVKADPDYRDAFIIQETRDRFFSSSNTYPGPGEIAANPYNYSNIPGQTNQLYARGGAYAPTGYYTVQVAAHSIPPLVSEYTALSRVGLPYYVREDGFYKVQVGQYDSEAAARTSLAQVKQLGYSKAFVRDQPAEQPTFLEDPRTIATRSPQQPMPTSFDTRAFGNNRTYTVRKGDTLLGIARKFNMELRELRALNNIYTDRLQIGQVLQVY